MVAVNTLHTGAYTNADGLTQYFGTGEAIANKGGEYQEAGSDRHVTEVVISLPGLAAFGTTDELVVSENNTIPAGALIEEVRVIVLKETAGATANLDLGLVKASDHSTEIDFDGFLAAADAFHAGTDLGSETIYVKGTTEAGALVGSGVPLTYTGLITASAETADFTAGVIKVKIFWSIPLTADL